jgi:hypothetical protein
MTESVRYLLWLYFCDLPEKANYRDKKHLWLLGEGRLRGHEGIFGEKEMFYVFVVVIQVSSYLSKHAHLHTKGKNLFPFKIFL